MLVLLDMASRLYGWNKIKRKKKKKRKIYQNIKNFLLDGK